MTALHKEVGKLRVRLDAKIGYEKIIDLENRIKEADMIYSGYVSEYKGLETIKEKQDKDYDILIQSKESTEKITELNNQLKEAKERNKELEKKIQADSMTYQKQHESFVNLQEKLKKIKEEKFAWKKALAEGLPPPKDDKPQGKKSEEEMLKNTILLIRKKMNFERNAHKKQMDALNSEMTQLQMSIKEIEQENKLNSAKIKQLKPLLKHNQLSPLNLPSGSGMTGTPEAEIEDNSQD